MAASAIAAVAATTSAGGSSSKSSLGPTPPGGAMARRYSSVNVKRGESSEGEGSVKRSKVIKLPSLPNTPVPPSCGTTTTTELVPNQSELMSHLTEEEKSILSKVFLKEEQFRRESSAAYGAGNLNVNNPIRRLSRSGQESSGHQVVTSSSLTTMSNLSPLNSPSTSSVASTTDLTRTTTMATSVGFGNCRICRKNLDSTEKYHFCNSCSGSVCEDCSSYISQSGKFFMCSSCRRKSSAIPDSLATDPGFLRRRSTMVSRDANTSGFQGHVDPSQRLPCDSPLSMDQSPLHSRDQSESPSFRDHSRDSASSFRDFPSGRFSADGSSISGRGRDSTLSNTSSTRSPGPGRSSSGEGQRSLRTVSGSSVEGHPSITRRSLTASDSSPEEDAETTSDASAYQQSRSTGFKNLNRKRFSSQSSFDNGDSTAPYDTSTSSIIQRRPSNVGGSSSARLSGSGQNMLLPGGGGTVRKTASELYLDTNQSRLLVNEVRRKSDSPSSDISCDMMMMRPVGMGTPGEEAMSSPDWTRGGSPRQSGDSEHVLHLPSMGQLPQQRRSIPSVLVDPNTGLATELNYLSLKDCFGRRSSTGRALPKIPVEQSRSLLDLPGERGRTGSSHSLDLPHDQPRRASAPEGENIRIVIDDVDSSGLLGRSGRSSSTQGRIERVILHRDPYDKSARTRGFGLFVTGGKFNKYDGRMYAYVGWVTPSGPADKMGLKPGDKILEWDGNCLINASLEQVLRVIDSSASQAELLVDPLNREERKGFFIHQRRRLSTQISVSLENSAGLPPSQLSAAPNPSHLSHSNEELVSGSSPSRPGGRRLPRPPGTPTLNPTPSLAIVTLDPEIMIDFNLDSERRELQVTLLAAKGLPQLNARYCFVRIQILPKEGFEACQTELCSTFEWNETIIFQSFPLERMVDMGMEAIIFETDGQTKESRIAEVMIPMATIESSGHEWWPLFVLSDIPPVPQFPVYGNLNLSDNQSARGGSIQGSRSMPGSRRNSDRGINVGPLLQGQNTENSGSEYQSSEYQNSDNNRLMRNEAFQAQNQRTHDLNPSNLMSRTRHGSIMDLDTSTNLGGGYINSDSIASHNSTLGIDQGTLRSQRRASSSTLIGMPTNYNNYAT